MTASALPALRPEDLGHLTAALFGGMFAPAPTDVETTDLDPVGCALLEFHLHVATRDHRLEKVADFGTRVLGATEEQLARMNDYVHDMHTGTGLLDEVRESSLAVEELDDEVTTWLHEQGFTASDSLIILGSSCRFDRQVIEAKMPALDRLMTHRMMDASGLNEVLDAFLPAIARQAEELFVPPRSTRPDGAPRMAHRAEDDAAWSVAQMRALVQSISIGVPRP